MKWRQLFVGLFILGLPQAAQAHSPVPGIEGFYVGLLHPFSTPSQALLMIALALAAGRFTADGTKWLLPGFGVASLTGLLFAYGISALDPAMFAVAFAASACAALGPGRLLPVIFVLVVVGAFLIGDASVPDAGPTRDRMFTMSGSIVGANVGFLYLVGLSFLIRERFSKPWVAIAFRVAAAWVGAISLLMLALSFAETPLPA